MRSGYLKNGTRWHGMVEIDLLHPKLCGRGHKIALLRDLDVDPSTLRPTERIALIHFHAVVDRRGHTAKEFKNALNAAFPGHRRVHIGPLHKDKPVSRNLENLSGYMTKLRAQYSQAFEDTPTRFYMHFEPEWADWFDASLNAVGLPEMIISSLNPRSKLADKPQPPQRPFRVAVRQTNSNTFNILENNPVTSSSRITTTFNQQCYGSISSCESSSIPSSNAIYSTDSGIRSNIPAYNPNHHTDNERYFDFNPSLYSTIDEQIACEGLDCEHFDTDYWARPFSLDWALARIGAFVEREGGGAEQLAFDRRRIYAAHADSRWREVREANAPRR